MIVNPASFDKPDLDQSGDGLGPYVVKPGTFKAGQAATLDRSTDPWWGDPAVGPHFAEIQTFPIQDVNARVNAVQSGQVDVADITPDQFSRAQQLASSGFQFKKYESQLNVAIALNLNSPVLQNAAVRQAMNLAIDRRGIDQAVFAGGCTPSVQPAPQGALGYDPALETAWAYNVDKAKQVLASAGVSNVTINAIQHTNASYSGANDAVAAELKQIGINFVLSQPIVSTQAIPKYQSGGADAFGFPLGGSLSPVGVLTDFAFGPYVVKGTTTPDIKQAATGLLDPKLSDAERQAKALATNRAITNDATFLTLCRIQRGAIASSKIVNLDQTSEIQLGTIDVERMAMKV
jgi:peptide/nickel transport system substrate-binding protein